MNAGSHPVCALCVAAADATRNDEPLLQNRKLLETPLFVVLPSVGPIVPGHVMVVSKEHYPSLASMGTDAIAEYERLAAQLRKAPFLSDGLSLEAEHGSSVGDKAGACVVHTHVHWVPGMARLWSEFQSKLRRRTESTLTDIRNNTVPYIFARAGEQAAVFRAEGLRSQTIRRILCEAMDRDDTDWTQALRPNWVKETVDAWAKSNKNR